ncbi:AraC family transcriptional regulator [Algiphilus aromaticivorans]|uniref:AraC family transcriptional regulator n=1 Tax=Algiphilus aromaticivorans TaxID=382454 RepID=UPI001E46808D|nr:AraC family transcriptional regulator [Algiphilus aromaticivorans]
MESSAQSIAAGSMLAECIAPFATAPGINETPWPGVEVLRADAPGPRRPVVYEPTVCVVAQGRKRVYLGDDSFVYDAWHYLVLSVPLPMDGEILEASPEHPFLALRLHLNATALGEIMLQAGVAGDVPSNPAACRGVCASRFDAALHDAVCRLAAAVGDPRERPVLAPLAEREVLYRLVTGERGQLLREFALRDSRSYRISRVLQHIRNHFDQPLDVPSLARIANMSPSALHHGFRAVTSSSPMQYLKKIRLHQARTLMLHDGVGAGIAARRVGYNSEFQFSREYRRLFGQPPMRDVAALRAESGAVGAR